MERCVRAFSAEFHFPLPKLERQKVRNLVLFPPCVGEKPILIRCAPKLWTSEAAVLTLRLGAQGRGLEPWARGGWWGLASPGRGLGWGLRHWSPMEKAPVVMRFSNYKVRSEL